MSVGEDMGAHLLCCCSLGCGDRYKVPLGGGVRHALSGTAGISAWPPLLQPEHSQGEAVLVCAGLHCCGGGCQGWGRLGQWKATGVGCPPLLGQGVG